jgi:hypothetical protein
MAHLDPTLATIEGVAVLGAVAISSAIAGVDPNVATAINSLALLGVAVISAWTAAKSAARDRKLESVKKTGEATHTLSNSAMGAQLKMNVTFARAAAVMARRLAEVTKQSGDTAAAAAADVQVIEQEAILQVHLIQQARVDAELAKDQQMK